MEHADAVDRLVHHSTIFELNVESYRRRTARRKQQGPGRPYARDDPILSIWPESMTMASTKDSIWGASSSLLRTRCLRTRRGQITEHDHH
jgi:hypothetical protein